MLTNAPLADRWICSIGLINPGLINLQSVVSFQRKNEASRFLAGTLDWVAIYASGDNKRASARYSGNRRGGHIV